MYSHPESIAVFLTDAHAKFTYFLSLKESLPRQRNGCGKIFSGTRLTIWGNSLLTQVPS
jgi:hypothetical protein